MCRLACLVLLWLSVFCDPLAAQVYPGDADHTGRVEHLDVLPIGYAYGTVGPARVESGTDFQESSILLNWEETFPDGLNYAHADANGNGLVEIGDLLAVFLNYGQELPGATSIAPPAPTPGVDPGFELSTMALPSAISQGALLEIPIHLGTAGAPLTLNGLAFSIAYEADYVQQAQLDFSNSWLDAGGQSFYLQQPVATDPAVIQSAQTRFGVDPITGFGEIARLLIVIEDDLIGLLPVDIDSTRIIVRIKAERVVDGGFNNVPLFADSLELMLYHPDYLLDTPPPPAVEGPLRIYPNPTYGAVYLDAPGRWDELLVFDPLGRRVRNFDLTGQLRPRLDLSGLPVGIYLLRLRGPAGVRSGLVKVE